VRFTGGVADEIVSVSPSRMVRGVDMGAGDDELWLNGGFGTRTNAHATEPLDGGAGTDTIDVRAWQGQHVRVDLADDRLDYRFDNAGPPQNRIPAFENAHVLAESTRVSGDSGPNVISWNGCPGVARGRGGDDILRFVGSPIVWRSCRSGPQHPAMYGGAGDDELLGSKRWDDRLVGGAGVDSANGRGGHDTCQAETTVECEVVLRQSDR
jgi:Ca2+-binding RTX toxin-like protein